MTLDFKTRLKALLPSGRLIDGSDTAPFVLDWRKRYQGRALAVAQTSDVTEVVALAKFCHEHRIPMVTQGGNTSLVGGSIPDDSGHQLVISLQRMTGIRKIDLDNGTITAEAGCTVKALQEAASQCGMRFPLSLASEGQATLGGILATNAGGTQVLRWGNARDLCLGLEVVTAQGELWSQLNGLRKDNTGYSLRDLFIGSEGTLGIITAATMKLVPKPRSEWTAWTQVGSMEQAVALLRLCQQELGSGLTGFEVMNGPSLDAVAQQFPDLKQRPWGQSHPQDWTVLLEFEDSQTPDIAQNRLHYLLASALEGKLVLNAVLAHNETQSRQLWQVREAIPLAQAAQGLNIKHDISLAVSAIPRFISEMAQAISSVCPQAKLITFGHLGDGNLHYNIQAPEGLPADEFLKQWQDRLQTLVHDQVHQMEGSISAEHGIGQFKRELLPKYKSPVALSMMKAIKTALDPQGLLNPGKLL